MSTSPLPDTTPVEDDPRRPWKAVATLIATTILVALRDYFAGNDEIAWEGLLFSVGSGVIAALVTYFTRNPKSIRTAR